ncbi:BnaA02g13930D [Brassica napus]|uniref:BnaA02g13930D protein n=1 Tax=Brassica napus TaxID=3708 RepID=A0A078I620_BRANA|nr:BnaA02g13930D [Brassica napus]
MSRRLSRSDKEKWVAVTPPPTKRLPLRIPASDNTDLIAANKLTIIGRVTNPSIQNTRAILNFLPQVWGLEGRVEGRDLATVTTIGEELGFLADKVVEEAKVRVELNGFLPLVMNMEIQLPSDEIITVEFEYIKIEKHCFTCFSLFHEDETCPIKPRNSLPVKDRKLGITQRIALQRIEADKRRHDDRRGYRRPNQLPPPTGNVRDDHRQRNTHYSDHRASSRTTQDAASSRHREPHYHGSSFHRSPPRESRRSIREDSRVLSSGVKVQNQDVPIDPLSNPFGPSRSLSSHTPSPRNLRERLDFPPEAGGSGGVSLANSSERRSVLARIGRSSPGNAPPTRGPASFDSARLQEVEIMYDGSAGQEHISPFHASATDGGQSSRIPVALRLGGVSDPSATISARDTSPPPVFNFNTKTTGKRKVSKTTAPRKRVVARSPLKGVKVRKTNVARSVNPPRKKQCVERALSLPCDKAGPSATTRATTRARRTDFRPPSPPLP